MRRNSVLVGLAIALIAIVVIVARSCGGHGASSSHATTTTTTSATGSAGKRMADRRVDPRTLRRGSIAGTITDEAHAPIANARVCGDAASSELSAQLTRDPICTSADAQGHYTLPDLIAATYTVVASAKPFRPTAFHPDGDRHRTTFALAPGEAKSGVDIVLRAGGVEITGTVSDVTGGPIEKALVRVRADWDEPSSPPVETDAQGTFSLWTAPEQVAVEAAAEGYTNGTEFVRAPGTVEILLTPESSVAGTVVDAVTSEPVPGVTVELRPADNGWNPGGDPSDITDDKGQFRVTRITPGRFTAVATAPHGYGRANGSTLVGLGQHVEGVLVRLHPGFRLSGTIVRPDKTTCVDGSASLGDKQRDTWVDMTTEPDGAVHADGLLPGTYQISIRCPGFVARETYDAITIVDKDVENVQWPVDAGATIKGRLVTKRGEPVPDATVFARSVGGGPRGRQGWGGEDTLADGSFTIAGLRPGSYKLEASTDKGVPPLAGWSVDVAPGAVVEKELVLDDAGRITGTVVDADGKPVGNILVRAQPVAARIGDEGSRTGSDGTFVIEGLYPGDYRVSAQRTWANTMRRPGSTDDSKQGERVTLVPGKTVTVKLVVETLAGVITGSVVGSDGTPVTDAYVSAARESESGAPGGAVIQTRWSWDQKPVITGVDGSFKVTKLSPGTYTVRAAIKGGGEAVAEHVPVNGTAKLELRPTGSITAHVTAPAGALDEYSVDLRNSKTGFSRRERYFRNGGTFVLDALPAGHYTLTVSAGSGKKQVDTDLAEGQAVTLAITLDPLVTITGRVIDQVTKQPVPGMRMMVQMGRDGGGGFGMRGGMDPNEPNVSGDDGRFTIADAPTGQIMLRGFPKDFRDSDYIGITMPRTIAGTGTVDVGDVLAFKRRVKQGDPVGELGISFAEDPPGTPMDARTLKVRLIDPQGPAAKSGLVVGDLVVSIDGVDVTGAGYMNAWTLLRAPPGTKLALGLQRGTTVSITLAAP